MTAHGRPLAEARVYVAGHTGLLGGAVCRVLAEHGVAAPICRSHADLDLTRRDAVDDFFAEQRPQVVFLCAARVGGIAANAAAPATFLSENLAIQDNVLRAAWRHGAGRLVFMASSCIYPRSCPQPMREEHLLSGPLEITNQAYAVAKIAGVEACRAYNREHGTRFVALMPSNLYGPGDRYDLETGHVLAALIRKCHEARACGSPEVTVWGSGTPLREFTWSEDAARAAVLMAGAGDERLARAMDGLRWPMLNAGAGEEVSIDDLARRVAAAVGFTGRFRHDPARPDGAPRKILDSRRLAGLGWRPRVLLEQGIPRAYADFRAAARAGAQGAESSSTRIE